MPNDDSSNGGQVTELPSSNSPATQPIFQSIKLGDIKMAISKGGSKVALNSASKLAGVPANLLVSLPNDVPSSEDIAKIKKFGSPSDIQSALNWDRVTDQQREADKTHYKELQNYGQNVIDGIKTVTVAVKAATEVTKLGQALIGYAIGVEGIRTQEVNLNIAQEKTAQRNVVLQGEQQKTTHLGQVNQAKQSLYAADLDNISQMLAAKQAKSRLAAAEVSNQVIDVDAY
jgi:hypothetical protein